MSPNRFICALSARSTRGVLGGLSLLCLLALAQPAHSATTLSESKAGAEGHAARKPAVPPRPLVLDPVDDTREARAASGKDASSPDAPKGAFLAAGGALGLAAVSLLARRLVSRRSSSSS